MFRKYLFEGYCRVTGKRKIISVQATTIRHGKTIAYQTLTYPRFVGYDK